MATRSPILNRPWKCFKGEVIVITGASSGIGAELAVQLAGADAQVVLLGRRKDRLDKLARKLAAQGKKAFAIACDVSNEAAVRDAAALTIAKFVNVNRVIANAGFSLPGSLEVLGSQDIRRQFDTNVMGVFHTIQAFMPKLREIAGHVVIIGSANSYVTLPGIGAYAMSKFAVRALSETLGHEVTASGVGVTLILPGFVESEIRQLDSRGFYQADNPDPIPKWMLIPTSVAVHKMLRAIAWRRSEVVIGWHARFAVFMARHFPRFTRFTVRRLRLEVRKWSARKHGTVVRRAQT